MDQSSGVLSPALLRLRTYADERRSGEVIVASAQGEIHVYLQEGRVAWATSAAARFAFTRYLSETCQVDKSDMRRVIEECQRTRKPLGETLVEWKIASEEQVRMALRAQVVASLSDLNNMEKAQDLFLDRGEAFREYDPFLTFDIKSLEPDIRPAAAIPTKSAPRPFETPAEIVRHLANERGDDLLWVAVVRGLDVLVEESLGEANVNLATLERIAPFASVEGATLTAVREACCGLVGVPLPEHEATLWCALRPEANLPAIVRHLDNIAGISPTEPVIRSDEKNRWQAIVNPQFLIASRTIEDAIEQTPELRAAYLARKPGGDPSLIRRLNEPFEPALTLSARMVKHLHRLHDRVVDDAPDLAAVERAGRMQLWIRTPERVHCATVEQLQPRFNLWLVFDSDTSIGFTEALLFSLSRQVMVAFEREHFPDDRQMA